jgi:eukaryotic-like serine/threonine-protein kinase
MKSFVRFALRVLVLLLVALISALTAMRFAIHGREVSIPNLVGKTPIEARRTADDSGLSLISERQYYSDTIPEGRIISQIPAAGTRVREGWQVRVAESLGKQRVEIPNVLGQTQRAAELNLQSRGLDVASTASLQLSGVMTDAVIAQDPPPAASGVSAPNVSLLVATASDQPAFVMPSFSGQTLARASAAIIAAGWKATSISSAVTSVGSSGNPQSATIVSQTPTTGSKIVLGAPISFVAR